MPVNVSPDFCNCGNFFHRDLLARLEKYVALLDQIDLFSNYFLG